MIKLTDGMITGKISLDFSSVKTLQLGFNPNIS